MQYSYPEIRDVFTICAEAVAPDPRTNRGYIRPRSDGMGKILQNVLSMKNVKFELKPGGLSIVSGANVQEIFFDLGQNKAIDTTVNEMSEDLDLPMRVNNLFRRAANYNPEAERVRREKREGAIDKLKNIITKIEKDIRSSDGGKYFYFYAPYDRLGEAESAFWDLDMATLRHVSHLDGQEVMVLRYPATMIPGEALEVIEQLRDAIKSRRDDRGAFERGSINVNQKEILDALKKMISSIKLAQYSGESEPSYRYFYLHDANVYNVKHAMELMKQLGISGIEEYFSETSGQSVLRLPIKGVDGRAQGIIDELNGAIAARAKQDALKQLKEKINGYTPYESDGLRYIYLTFPLNFMAKAQEFLRVLGISAEQHNMRINRNAAKRPDFRSINSNGMDYFVSSLSGGIPVLGIIEPTAKDSAWNVLYELKNAVTAKAGAKRDMGGRPGI